MERLYYEDLEIGQEIEFQKWYDEGLVDEHFEGVITNMDGQNIVIQVSENNYEVCNPAYAVVKAK